MDRLALLIFLMTGIVVSGTVVGIEIWMGYTTLMIFFVSVIISWIVAWPISYWISRRIKTRDPGWDEERERRKRQPRTQTPD